MFCGAARPAVNRALWSPAADPRTDSWALMAGSKRPLDDALEGSEGPQQKRPRQPLSEEDSSAPSTSSNDSADDSDEDSDEDYIDPASDDAMPVKNMVRFPEKAVRRPQMPRRRPGAPSTKSLDGKRYRIRQANVSMQKWYDEAKLQTQRVRHLADPEHGQVLDVEMRVIGGERTPGGDHSKADEVLRFFSVAPDLIEAFIGGYYNHSLREQVSIMNQRQHEVDGYRFSEEEVLTGVLRRDKKKRKKAAAEPPVSQSLFN